MKNSEFPIAAHPLILFDGVCNLCNGAVQYVIKHDKKKRFRFGSLQGETGQKILAHYNLPSDNYNSFLLIENGKCYSRSTAALRVLKHLGYPLKLGYALIIIPSFIRDFVYGVIARNRYKWFGKQDSCWMPTPDLKSRFVDQDMQSVSS